MRLSNELFARAVYWLIDNKKVEDQQELSEVTGITETTISRILNDKVKKPSKETIRKLLDAFPGIFNPSYFWGDDIYMTMEDKMDAMMDKQPTTSVDISSMTNSIIAAKDDAIESLKRELTTKDSLIADLEKRIKEKDDFIVILKKQVTTLSSQLRQQGINEYPFPVGVADERKTQHKR